MLGNDSTPLAFRCCGSSVSIARFRSTCPEAHSSVSSASWTVSTTRPVPGHFADLGTGSCEKPSTSKLRFLAEAHRDSSFLTSHNMHSARRVDTLSLIVQETCESWPHGLETEADFGATRPSYCLEPCLMARSPSRGPRACGSPCGMSSRLAIST